MKCTYIDVRVFEDTARFEKAFQSILWPQRREKILRYRNKKSSLLCLGAGYLMGRELSPFFDPDAPVPEIAEGEKGKPYLPDYPELYFNLSHSGHYAAIVTGAHPCGVDVERDHAEYQKISDHFFTEEEQQYIKNSSDPKDAFLQIWTRKESFIKCSGEGISRDFHSFDVISGIPNDIQFYEHVLPGHRLAVCAQADSSGTFENFESFEEVFFE